MHCLDLFRRENPRTYSRKLPPVREFSLRLILGKESYFAWIRDKKFLLISIWSKARFCSQKIQLSSSAVDLSLRRRMPKRLILSLHPSGMRLLADTLLTKFFGLKKSNLGRRTVYLKI